MISEDKLTMTNILCKIYGYIHNIKERVKNKNKSNNHKINQTK